MSSYLHSSSYFEEEISLSKSGSIFCFFLFLLPFVLAFKVLKSFFRAAGVLIGLGCFICSLGLSASSRNFFIRRVASLFTDIADWFLFPFALLSYFFRFFLKFFKRIIVFY